jgi:hypothetical protein
LAEIVFESDRELAKRLSVDSNISVRGWMAFLEQNLWSIPTQSILDTRISKKQLLFAVLGSKYIWLYCREYNCDFYKEEEDDG